MSKDNLRSQLKATKITSLKKTVDADNNLIGANNNEYLQLEDGKTTKIRIFPAHPGNEKFYISKKSYWLSYVNSDGDVKRTTVLDSKQHGGTTMDVVEEYIKMVKKKHAKNNKIINVLTERDGLNPSYTWLAYAGQVIPEETINPMLWEFKKMVRDGLNKLAFSEEEDEPIEVDPFTDVDDGVPVMVKYIKKPNKKKGENFYEVNFPKKMTARPLTDEEIDSFMALKPLEELLHYSSRDFDRALEGLQYFDESNEIGLFEDEDWNELLEEIKAQYDSDEDEEDEKPSKKSFKKPSKKVVEEEDDDEEEEAPKPKKKKVVVDDDDDDEEEEEAPKKKVVKKPVVEDDDDDEEEEETPKKKVVKKPVVEEEEDDDEIPAPKKKKVVVEEEDDDDDDDDEPVKKPKMSLADIKKKMAKK